MHLLTAIDNQNEVAPVAIHSDPSYLLKVLERQKSVIARISNLLDLFPGFGTDRDNGQGWFARKCLLSTKKSYCKGSMLFLGVLESRALKNSFIRASCGQFIIQFEATHQYQYPIQKHQSGRHQQS